MQTVLKNPVPTAVTLSMGRYFFLPKRVLKNTYLSSTSSFALDALTPTHTPMVESTSAMPQNEMHTFTFRSDIKRSAHTIQSMASIQKTAHTPFELNRASVLLFILLSFTVKPHFCKMLMYSITNSRIRQDQKPSCYRLVKDLFSKSMRFVKVAQRFLKISIIIVH